MLCGTVSNNIPWFWEESYIQFSYGCDGFKFYVGIAVKHIVCVLRYNGAKRQ